MGVHAVLGNHVYRCADAMIKRFKAMDPVDQWFTLHFAIMYGVVIIGVIITSLMTAAPGDVDTIRTLENDLLQCGCTQ